MLSYFKYFAVITFVLVAIAAFFAGLYFRSFAADKVIRQPIEQQNIAVIEGFTRNIWCKYEPSFRALATQPAATWQADPEFAKFSRISKTILVSAAAFKINFYPTSKEQILTTNEIDIPPGNKEKEQNSLTRSFAGDNNSIFLPSVKYSDKSGEIIKRSFVKSYILLDTKNCESPGTQASPEGNPLKVAVEIYTDVTKPWQELHIFQLAINIGIITTFLLLYLALFLTSKKAEKIINTQHEEKLKLEKAKTSAEMQNQQKSMFLANVSHELRTPLNAIIGFSDIIKDEVMGPIGHPQYKEYINDINSSGVHLLSLINDILDYSKAEARKLEVEFVDIDATKIAHSCLRLVEPRAKEAKVNLVEHTPDKHIILSADPKRMKQVILNLLSNSIKFTPEGGQIALSIEEDVLEGKVIIKVSDSGIGIEAKDISKALAPFGQIDSSLSRKYEGTGLGLPLTMKLTEIMGGLFSIASEVGLGTTVTLTFPIISGNRMNGGR